LFVWDFGAIAIRHSPLRRPRCAGAGAAAAPLAASAKGESRNKTQDKQLRQQASII
jgi:hypothetical protein